MSYSRRQALSAVGLALLSAAIVGVAVAAEPEAVRLSEIEKFAQQLAEQAARHAKEQGWDVSEDNVGEAKKRILQTLRKTFKEQKIAIRPTC